MIDGALVVLTQPAIASAIAVNVMSFVIAVLELGIEPECAHAHARGDRPHESIGWNGLHVFDEQASASSVVASRKPGGDGPA